MTNSESPWTPPPITLGDGETAMFHGEYDGDGTFIVRDIEKLPATDKPRATLPTLHEAITALEAEMKRLTAWRRRLMWAMALNVVAILVNVGMVVYRLWP